MGCLVVGLTGQTGAGKSTVSRLLAAAGIPVVDCDHLAREAVRPGSECLAQLADAFGPQIIQPDGSLDRAKTAQIAFSDPDRLKTLNRITHKAILVLLERQLEDWKAAGESLIAVDAPTLFESGANRFCAVVISVIASQELRYERIMARDDLTPEAAQRRMGAQQPDDFYTSRSDYVLVNDGLEKDLAEKTESLIRILKEKAGISCVFEKAERCC